MREKLRIARQFRISRRRTRNKECKRLYSKCYLAYVRQCIVGGKDDFEIIFNGKYLEPFKVRFEDWAIYWMEQIRRFYLMHFVSEKRLTGGDWMCIHHPLQKPFAIKVADIPDETILYRILENNGFKVTDEYMNHILIIYEVSRA